jgi:hypothetical protein
MECRDRSAALCAGVRIVLVLVLVLVLETLARDRLAGRAGRQVPQERIGESPVQVTRRG